MVPLDLSNKKYSIFYTLFLGKSRGDEEKNLKNVVKRENKSDENKVVSVAWFFVILLLVVSYAADCYRLCALILRERLRTAVV